MDVWLCVFDSGFGLEAVSGQDCLDESLSHVRYYSEAVNGESRVQRAEIIQTEGSK